ncbi:glycosyltransferase [Microvirga sp. Mcv34]|uniref:glycosyltransferase n=1 Tax=Microvirga sp. Mcv34 TaxID=2926016 RepID=UPI0021C8A8FC|nr:glycosyltransferase [Microvirga sp. Mcv34]
MVSLTDFLENPCFAYDVYVFHRPSADVCGFQSSLEDLRRLGKRLLADYDDLIFGTDEEALSYSTFRSGLRSKKQVTAMFSANLLALLEFDLFSTSTDPLKQQVMRFKPSGRCETIPNAVPASIISIAEENAFFLAPRSSNTVGYFAGTKTHDKDLPVAEEGVLSFLENDRTGRFLVVGPVSLPATLTDHPRVVQHGLVDYLYLPKLMQQCSTVVAPLEQTSFNDCKSRVKFLEASLAGCRLVATPIPDIRAVASHSADLPQTRDEWVAALARQHVEPVRAALAAERFRYLKEECHAARSADALLLLLGE